MSQSGICMDTETRKQTEGFILVWGAIRGLAALFEVRLSD